MTSDPAPTYPFPRDKLRVVPEIRSEHYPHIYLDTCAFCAHYSRHFAGCRIREADKPDCFVDRAKRPLSVAANEKCIRWEPVRKE